MVEKRDGVAYTLGILSVVLAFFQPVAAIVLGIVGIVQGNKDKTPLSKKAKVLSKVGIVLGVIMLVITLWVTFYYASNAGVQFPVA